MIKLFTILLALTPLLMACWPTSVSFNDTGSMDPCWERFMVDPLENNAANAPLSYPTDLGQAIKNGVQNNTRLLLTDATEAANIIISGKINSYVITPIALQEGDNSAKNRLTISTQYSILTLCPEEDEMTLSSTRFADFNSTEDISSVETKLLTEINDQIVQDVINKLLSNW